ncbi:MAG TPA: CdaR family protein [Anaerolineae bacterium]|nr:CdaR family protein [Anaerolineae bacterium]
MSALRRWVFSNWPLKLTALGLAVVLYAGLSISESTRSWSGPVPIEVLNAPTGGALLDDPGAVDRIEYLAPDAVAAQISSDSFRASVDLSSVQPRVGATTVEVPVDVFPVDPRVRIVGYEPTGVVLRVDEVVSRVMPVQVDHGPLPEGIEMGPVAVDPNQVTVRGASSRLQNVRSVEGRFVVDASAIDIDRDVVVEAFDEVGAIVPGIDIDPGTVRVRADVARQLAYATLPVVPELSGEPERGVRVDNVSVVPGTITVSGENPIIRELESITTEPVDISGQSVELVTEARLVLPPDVTASGDGLVSVLVTFTQAFGSRAFDIGTALVGAQPAYSYRLEEPAVSVVISGPLAELDGLAIDDLIAEVPVADLAVGDNDVMPIVQTPRGTSVVRVTPETVRVTVTPVS